MDGENNLDLRVSHFIPEGTEDKEEGVRKVEKWLTERHGRFHTRVSHSSQRPGLRGVTRPLPFLGGSKFLSDRP
jgi:hypothetical protein